MNRVTKNMSVIEQLWSRQENHEILSHSGLHSETVSRQEENIRQKRQTMCHEREVKIYKQNM